VTVDALIDDFSRAERASNGQRWRFFSDQVMGGVSTGTAEYAELDGRRALRLAGTVSLDNNGGFIQVALDLADNGRSVDALAFRGIAITLRGDGGAFAVNLRTTDLRYPWQSYRHPIASSNTWHTYQCPFTDFEAHRTDRPLDPGRLRRVGLIAIGEARDVDVAIAELRFYR
jgi:hypothetical protein